VTGNGGQIAGDPLAERAALVSKLTHEIRGPVSTIRGLASTTLAHYERLDDGERREFLELIRHEAERLERTVEQVALALKLDAGTLRFDIRRQDLGTIVRGAVDAAETGEHPVEVDTEHEVDAPVDGIQIGFVVRQLLENAAIFSPAGAPISIRLTSEGDHALISVVDRGPGIPEGERDGVFERFAGWRPPGYEDRPGTGLGLFICRAIVEEHGGDASIADAPTEGTMLVVRLPMEARMAGSR
jgi:two-component system, OmpR family, sensor histidine kinase KdpD